MSEATSEPKYQMSARNRRRFYIWFAVGCAVLFLGGIAGYLLDFRHQQICPGGAAPVSTSSDDFGQVSYLCPHNKTVSPGFP